jgi:MraZ protein
MALLVGKQHLNKIDKKGRVSVPKPFRDIFESQGFRGLYAFPSFKFPAIELCGKALLERISQSLDTLAMFSDDQDDLATVIMNNAEELPFDPEGRIVLPKEFLDHAGLVTEALFVGGGARCQIWEPKAFAEQNRRAFERARSRGATLPLRPLIVGDKES